MEAVDPRPHAGETAPHFAREAVHAQVDVAEALVGEDDALDRIIWLELTPESRARKKNEAVVVTHHGKPYALIQPLYDYL